MADNTKIEWTDATWNPVTGCTVVSDGCSNCYAMRLAGGILRRHPSREGLTKHGPNGPVWTGEVRLNEAWINHPIFWRKPRMVFVCTHGDLFHEAVPDEWIDRVFAVMALCPQHTFQVLTKRPERMKEYLSGQDGGIVDAADFLAKKLDRYTLSGNAGHLCSWTEYGDTRCDIAPWPLPNVWLGVSVEDQATAEERIPHLMETPAAVRFLSAEPLLGPVNLFDACQINNRPNQASALDWVIVGGESGPNARPMDADWARSLRDQCASDDVPFFFKQWGAYAPHTYANGTVDMVRFNKKRAGRKLDGVEHNAMPDPRHREDAA